MLKFSNLVLRTKIGHVPMQRTEAATTTSTPKVDSSVAKEKISTKAAAARKRMQQKHQQQLLEDAAGQLEEVISEMKIFERDHSGRSMEAKRTSAFCTAASYRCSELMTHLIKEGYECARFGVDVIHATPKAAESGDIFFFKNGAVVFWGVASDIEAHILRTLRPFENNSLAPASWESDEMEYYLTDSPPEQFMRQDTIFVHNKNGRSRILQMLAYSYAIFRSVRIGALENDVAEMSEDMRALPNILLKPVPRFFGGKQRLEVQRKMHKIQSLSSAIILHADLLDPPELFWDEPNLEAPYEKISHELDLTGRIERLNVKLKHAMSLVQVLQVQEHESNSKRIEVFIAFLIAVEIGLELIFHYF